MYGTYPLLLRVRVDTDTRFKPYDKEQKSIYGRRANGAERSILFDWWNDVRKKEMNQEF